MESGFDNVTVFVVWSGVTVGVITGAVMTGFGVTVADTESVAGEQDKSGGGTAALDAWWRAARCLFLSTSGEYI